MSVQAPADKRFRRAHVAPTRRRRLWPPDWKVVAGSLAVVVLVSYAGYRGLSWATGGDALVIQRITVEGHVRLSAGEVTSLLDGLRGQNMLTADLESWKDVLKASPWVADVAFRRVFPGRIAVAVIERTPIGIGRLGDTLFLVDRHGTLIDEYGPNYAELDLPLLSGLDGGAAGDGPRVDDVRAALAVRVVDAISTRRDLAARVSEIDVTDAYNAVLTLKDDPTLVRVGDDEFVRRLQTYLELAPTLRERVPGADYADVRFDNRIYVRPAGAMPAGGIRAVSDRAVSDRAAPDRTAPEPVVAPAVPADTTSTMQADGPAATAGPAKPRKRKGRRR
ncbi:MAG: cell division protein FtsQ/DivIB [Vicinamibacterales bacterium]